MPLSVRMIRTGKKKSFVFSFLRLGPDAAMVGADIGHGARCIVENGCRDRCGSRTLVIGEPVAPAAAGAGRDIGRTVDESTGTPAGIASGKKRKE